MTLTQKDFGTLAICAIRYCHGRQSYMPSTVQAILKPHLSEIPDRDLIIMINDCHMQRQMDLYGDPRIDKPGWLEWEEALKSEKARRNGH